MCLISFDNIETSSLFVSLDGFPTNSLLGETFWFKAFVLIVKNSFCSDQNKT